jgi:hypothetical protein
VPALSQGTRQAGVRRRGRRRLATPADGDRIYRAGGFVSVWFNPLPRPRRRHAFSYRYRCQRQSIEHRPSRVPVVGGIFGQYRITHCPACLRVEGRCVGVERRAARGIRKRPGRTARGRWADQTTPRVTAGPRPGFLPPTRPVACRRRTGGGSPTRTDSASTRLTPPRSRRSSPAAEPEQAALPPARRAWVAPYRASVSAGWRSVKTWGQRGPSHLPGAAGRALGSRPVPTQPHRSTRGGVRQ